MKNSTIDQAQQLLTIFCRTSPKELDTERLYCWTPDGDPLTLISPIDKSHKVASVRDVKHFRLLPLLILPRLHPMQKRPQLLFKIHPKWKAVFPSFELHRVPDDTSEIQAQVESEASKIFRFGSVSKVIPAGGLLSFKRSPTNREENLYCFPLYIVRGTVLDEDLPQYESIGWELKYISKADIENNDKSFTNPNGDVYRAIERIHSSWRRITNYAYEFDFVISFAGEQRALAEELIQEVRSYKPDVTIFYDREQNLLGKDLEELLNTACSIGSRFFIPIISKEYKEKMWPRHELQAALSRAKIDRKGEYILPLRYDNTNLVGIQNTVAFENINASNVNFIAKKIVQRLQETTIQ